MAHKFHQPVRMCIACRKREAQNSLLRLQCHEKRLESYSGVGRSFYLCHECLENEKKFAKALMRICKSGDKEAFVNKLKEIIAHERKS